MFLLKRQGMLGFASLLLFVVCSLTSCISTKKVVYFNDLKDDTLYPNGVITMDVTPYQDIKIESNDLLAITLQTISQNESNTPITSNAAGNFNPINAFMVDRNGYIELSLIGMVKVGGLTTSEARELIKQKAKEYYKEPVVNVRISNFDVEVMGDVTRTGVVNVQNEKANIFDIIAMSGDLQITGKRRNVTLIRTEGDKKKFVRFDLTSSDVFHSPYFYMKQRDIVYVEPNKFKVQNADNTFVRLFGFTSSILSIVSLMFAFRIVK